MQQREYLGTLTMGLSYAKTSNMQLTGYNDLDCAGDKQNRKSTTRYCFSLGSTVISWSSKKLSIVALSSTEAEYKVAVNATCEDV